MMVCAQTRRPNGQPAVVAQAQKSAMALMNRAMYVSTEGLTLNEDELHFDVAGTVNLGLRMGEQGKILLIP